MEYDKNAGQARSTFVVPVGAGGYAPEEIFLKVLEPSSAGGLYHKIRTLRILIEALIATAVVEVWVLRVGGDPTNAAHWFFSGVSHNAVGLSPLIELAGWAAVKLRVKSGGTAGNMPISAAWA
jgi:hypothetical protein